MRVLVKFFICLALFLASAPILELPGIFVTFSDILFVAVAGLIWLGKKRGSYIAINSSVWSSWLVGTIFIVFGLLVSSLMSTNPARALIVSSQYIFSLIVLPILLQTAVTRCNVEVNCIARWFILGLSFSAAFGFVVYISHPDFSSQIMIGGRMGSLFGNPNILGKMLGMSLPIGLFFFVKDRKERWWATLFPVTALLGLAVASSFGGLGVAATTLTVFIVASGVKRLWRLIFLILLLCGLVYMATSTYGLPEIFVGRVLEGIEKGELGSAKEKLGLISEAIDYISPDPIVGLGADMYKEVSDYGLPVHNTYLLLWAEGGILSFSGIIVLLAGTFLFGMRVWLREKILGAFVLSVLAGTVVSMITNTHVYGRFWFLPLIISMLVASYGRIQHIRGVRKW